MFVSYVFSYGEINIRGLLLGGWGGVVKKCPTLRFLLARQIIYLFFILYLKAVFRKRTLNHIHYK